MPKLVICTKTLTQRRIARRRYSALVASVASKSNLFWDNFYLQMSSARAVKFTKEDTLPASQFKLAIFHKDRLTSANEHGLHVRIGISFDMPVRSFKRNQAVKRAFQIAGHIGIRALVDHDCRGSVRHVHIANTAGHAGLLHCLLHLCGHVEKLRAARCFYFQAMHWHQAPRFREWVMTTALYSDAQDFYCRKVFAIPSVRPDPSAPGMAKDKAPSIAGPCAGRATAPENSHTPRAESLWHPARAQSCGAVYRSGSRSFCEPSQPLLAKLGRISSADRAIDPAFSSLVYGCGRNSATHPSERTRAPFCAELPGNRPKYPRFEDGRPAVISRP